MDTEDALHAHLDQFPGDATARLALADWLEENGRRERAAGYRAMGLRGLRPELWNPIADLLEWSWYSAAGYGQPEGGEHLPDDWMKAVWAAAAERDRDAYHQSWTEHATRREAEDAASRRVALPPDRQAELLNPAEAPA